MRAAPIAQSTGFYASVLFFEGENHIPLRIIMQKGGTLMTDEELSKQIQCSPEQGLSKVIALYGGICKAVLNRIIGPAYPQDIEECLMTAYYKVWRGIGKFDPHRGTLKAWIVQIARNQALDWLRRKGEEIIPLEEDILDPNLDLSLEDETVRHINTELVQQSIDGMDEPDRTIFIRRYYYLERVKTIADYLQISEKAVEHRLSRGRKRLKIQLLERGVILP